LFHKTSRAQILGSFTTNGSKTACSKYASIYLDGGLGIDIEAALDTVADVYKISRDPRDYLLVPARAVSANLYNENLDFFSHDELIRYRPDMGRRVYATFQMVPSFLNHNASNYALSRGVILDAHYNTENKASDTVKKAVFDSIGEEPEYDKFTECLVAIDASKDPPLAQGFKNGQIDSFSMGADVSSTVCSICGKEAATTWQFCDHIKGKYSRKAYKLDNGQRRIAYEICKDVIFRELSTVDDPADKTALVQDTVFDISQALSRPTKLSSMEVYEVSSFVAKYAKQIPESVAKLIYQGLN
jgi:hypothetical protein